MSTPYQEEGLVDMMMSKIIKLPLLAKERVGVRSSSKNSFNF